MADSLVLLPCRNLKIDEYGKRGGRQEMTGDGPREYELEYTTREAVGVRRRLGIDTERGSVTRFVLQLEHLVEVDGEQEWTTIVRYDHDSEGSAEAAHDVTEEGLHIDVYRDGEKYRTHELTPPMPAADALGAAEDHLTTHAEGYIRRFEQWHETTR
jgi:hypothetical protein